jgi:hypothetical protein
VNRILVPIEDASIDQSSLAQLSPSKQISLQYVERNGTYVLTLVVNMTYPTVTLENSACVTLLSCSADALLLGFASEQCYDQAVQTWPIGLVLVTNQDGCNPVDERGLYQVLSYQPEGYAPSRKRQASYPWEVMAYVNPTTWADVADSMEIEYGQRVTGTAASTYYTETVTSYFSHPTLGMTSSIYTTTMAPDIYLDSDNELLQLRIGT